MGANFSVVKTWIDAEVLTAADLNAEFQNVLTNLTPAGVDDESADITAMRATKDPYSGSAAVLPTSLQEEIQELRYMIAQITGKTYWYQDAEASLTPTGAILLWTTDTAPTGFLLCSGQAVNRTTYATLFALIGTTYGVGDGSTTFNVPDLRGRFPLGQDDMGGSSANRVTDTDADTLGGADGDELKDISHTHTINHTHAASSITKSGDSSSVIGENSANSYLTFIHGSATLVNITNFTAGYAMDVPYGAAGQTHAGNSGSGPAATQDIMPPFITLNYIIKT